LKAKWNISKGTSSIPLVFAHVTSSSFWKPLFLIPKVIKVMIDWLWPKLGTYGNVVDSEKKTINCMFTKKCKKRVDNELTFKFCHTECNKSRILKLV